MQLILSLALCIARGEGGGSQCVTSGTFLPLALALQATVSWKQRQGYTQEVFDYTFGLKTHL